MNRLGLEAWKQQGARTLKDVLTQKVQEILGTHVPQPLDHDVERELTRLAEA